MTQTQENPFIDPRFKNAWDKGYAAGSAACIQKDAEIARPRKGLEEITQQTYLNEYSFSKIQAMAMLALAKQ